MPLLRLSNAQINNTLQKIEYSPAQLFANGEQGAWYDPSDFSTLYQDSAGTTPVTQLGQPVGLMLDKSQGALTALGPELVTNGTFDSGTTGWSAQNSTLSVVGGRLRVTDAGAAALAYQSITVTSGSAYFLNLDYLFPSSNVNNDYEVTVRDSSLAGTILFQKKTGWVEDAETQMSGYFVATSSTIVVTLFPSSATNDYVDFDNVSIREIPGNHASQATAAARPTVQARVNLATGTDTLTGWIDTLNGITRSYPAVTTPNGIPAVLGQLDTSPGFTRHIVTAKSSGSHVYSIYVKAGTASQVGILLRNHTTGTILQTVVFNFASPSGNYESLGDGWYRIWVSGSAISAGDVLWLYWYPGNNVVGASGYGAGGQLEQGSTPTTYQRVTTDTDYADIGLPRYLEFDGVDDLMSTAAIDSIAQNDTGISVLTGVEAISGEWPMTISQYDSGAAKRVFQLGGSSTSEFQFTVQVANSFSATRIAATTRPAQKAVLLGQWDGENTASELSVNSGVTISASANTPTITSVQQAIIIGKADAPSATFTPGKLFQAIVRDTVTSGPLLDRTERYVARKTGVTL